MKLNAVIISTEVFEDLEKLGLTLRRPFDGLNNDELETYRDMIWHKTSRLSVITEGKYFCGSDDGKNFFAVANDKISMLEKIFPEFDIVKIDHQDFPWDRNPFRDFTN